eukprot:GFYU01009509.1.p1 GENE.GFYU01009509.1~~GFYU01009509.1.p1  ORF type:complete len:401 (-),score=113.08 GFYU01009509.1:48-1250(-)
MADNKRLVHAVLTWLKESSPGDESIEVAMQCISDTYGVDLEDKAQTSQYGIAPLKLPVVFDAGLKVISDAVAKERAKQQQATTAAASTDASDNVDVAKSDPETMFENFLKQVTDAGFFKGVEVGTEEYNKRFERAREKFTAKFDVTPKASPPMSFKQKAELAGKHKLEGNTQLSAKNYQGAIESYTKAIEVLPDDSTASHIFYSNRAAAHTHLSDYEAAIADCESAIEVNSSYPKAYSRLGLAYSSLGQYQEAIDYGYKKALELDPNNALYLDEMKSAQAKLDAKNNPAVPAGGGMPGMPGMGAGGMPDMSNLAGMMNNPEFMNMAQNMMSNPMFANMAKGMMNNPAMANMFGGAGAGAGGDGGRRLCDMDCSLLWQFAWPRQMTSRQLSGTTWSHVFEI